MKREEMMRRRGEESERKLRVPKMGRSSESAERAAISPGTASCSRDAARSSRGDIALLTRSLPPGGSNSPAGG